MTQYSGYAPIDRRMVSPLVKSGGLSSRAPIVSKTLRCGLFE